MTNIVHKNSGSTILASIAYERAPFGEPTKITREDGTYVLLKYDAAPRPNSARPAFLLRSLRYLLVRHERLNELVN